MSSRWEESDFMDSRIPKEGTHAAFYPKEWCPKRLREWLVHPLSNAFSLIFLITTCTPPWTPDIVAALLYLLAEQSLVSKPSIYNCFRIFCVISFAFFPLVWENSRNTSFISTFALVIETYPMISNICNTNDHEMLNFVNAKSSRWYKIFHYFFFYLLRDVMFWWPTVSSDRRLAVTVFHFSRQFK